MGFCRSNYFLLTLLHSERPKLHRVLAILSAKGLRVDHILEVLHFPGKPTSHQNCSPLVQPHIVVEIDHEIFSRVISPLPLIQEGQKLSSVTVRSMVNCLGGLSLPRHSVVRITYHPNLTIAVNRGCKKTKQQQQQ